MSMGGRLLIPSTAMDLSVEDRHSDQLMQELLEAASKPILRSEIAIAGSVPER